MEKQVYQIQIVLKGSKPQIWRKVLVPSDIFMFDFHLVIVLAMGWTGLHLHQFEIDGKTYSERDPDDDFWDESDFIDYGDMRLSEFMKKEGDKMSYEYDFGDGWEHNIVLEKILPFEKGQNYPQCIDGKMACPPEDCGGIGGYALMLEALKDPNHEEYEYYVDWIGEDFDPIAFNKEEVNEVLKEKDI